MDKTLLTKVIMKSNVENIKDILYLFTYVDNNKFIHSDEDIGFSTEYKYNGPLKFKDVKCSRGAPNIVVYKTYLFNLNEMTRTEEIKYFRYVRTYDPNRLRYKVCSKRVEIYVNE